MFKENLIGKLLKQLRKKKKLTQNVLSGLAGLDETHYNKIERGLRSPNLETLFKISYALDIKPHELILMIENELDKNEEPQVE